MTSDHPDPQPSDLNQVLRAWIDGLTRQRANIDALTEASMLFRADLGKLSATVQRLAENGERIDERLAQLDERLERVAVTTEQQAAVAQQQAATAVELVARANRQDANVADLVQTVRLLIEQRQRA